MNLKTRSCAACGKPVKGRSDKKFCDDYCRNNYNNSLNNDTSLLMRQVNTVLRKNRRILAEALGPELETVKTTRSKLSTAGFNFQYFTHLYTTKKGSVYHFCYEFGYLLLENNWLLIVKRKEIAE